MSDRAIQDILTGTWGAVSCALREDWDGFDLLLNECVWSAERSTNWSIAAVGGTAALLKVLKMDREDLLDVTEKYFSRPVLLAVLGESESVVDTLVEDIELYGTGVVVGRAVGQLGMAVEILTESFKLDIEPFLRRLCLSVACAA